MDCPFCESEAKTVELTNIEGGFADRSFFRPCCTNLHCFMYNGSVNCFPTELMAIKMWNNHRQEKLIKIEGAK